MKVKLNRDIIVGEIYEDEIMYEYLFGGDAVYEVLHVFENHEYGPGTNDHTAYVLFDGCESISVWGRYCEEVK